jgi:hypothetical protein
MKDQLAQTADELAGAIISRHGGAAAMTAMDYEIVAAMVRVFNSVRAADAGDLPRLVDSLAKLEGMLPPAKSTRTPLQDLHAHIAAVHGPGAPGLARGESSGDGRYPASPRGAERDDGAATAHGAPS